jgi:hypothetical protein
MPPQPGEQTKISGVVESRNAERPSGYENFEDQFGRYDRIDDRLVAPPSA